MQKFYAGPAASPGDPDGIRTPAGTILMHRRRSPSARCSGSARGPLGIREDRAAAIRAGVASGAANRCPPAALAAGVIPIWSPRARCDLHRRRSSRCSRSSASSRRGSRSCDRLRLLAAVLARRRHRLPRVRPREAGAVLMDVARRLVRLLAGRHPRPDPRARSTARSATTSPHVYTTDEGLAGRARRSTGSIGVDPRSEQTWPAYLRGVLAFSRRRRAVRLRAAARSRRCCPYSLGLARRARGARRSTPPSRS